MTAVVIKRGCLQMPVHSQLSVRLGERRLKIAELSRSTGISRGTLTRLYKDTADRVDLDVLDRLCRALDCDVGDLMSFSTAAKPARPAHETQSASGEGRSKSV
jgi:putative transcriptional regulator